MQIEENYKELRGNVLRLRLHKTEIHIDKEDFVNIPIKLNKKLTLKDLSIEDNILYSSIFVNIMDKNKKVYLYFIPITLNNDMEIEYFVGFIKIQNIDNIIIPDQDIYFLINGGNVENLGFIGMLDVNTKNKKGNKVEAEIITKNYIEIEITALHEPIFIGAVNVINKAKLPEHHNYEGLVRFYADNMEEIVFLKLLIENGNGIIYNNTLDNLHVYGKQYVLLVNE